MNIVEQANLDAAGRLYQANSMHLCNAQDESIFKSRPSTRYNPKLFMDGNKWCALFGENLQDGVAGFGASPEEAFQAFDKAWFKKIEPLSSETTSKAEK